MVPECRIQFYWWSHASVHITSSSIKKCKCNYFNGFTKIMYFLTNILFTLDIYTWLPLTFYNSILLVKPFLISGGGRNSCTEKALLSAQQQGHLPLHDLLVMVDKGHLQQWAFIEWHTNKVASKKQCFCQFCQKYQDTKTNKRN